MPAALPAQNGDRRLGNDDGADQVDLDLLTKRVQARVLDRSEIAVTGVVHDNIDATEGFHGQAERRLRCRGHVEGCKPKPFAEALKQRFERLWVPGRSDDAISRRERRLHDGAAEPARAAADEPDLGHSGCQPREDVVSALGAGFVAGEAGAVLGLIDRLAVDEATKTPAAV